MSINNDGLNWPEKESISDCWSQGMNVSFLILINKRTFVSALFSLESGRQLANGFSNLLIYPLILSASPLFSTLRWFESKVLWPYCHNTKTKCTLNWNWRRFTCASYYSKTLHCLWLTAAYLTLQLLHLGSSPLASANGATALFAILPVHDWTA